MDLRWKTVRRGHRRPPIDGGQWVGLEERVCGGRGEEEKMIGRCVKVDTRKTNRQTMDVAGGKREGHTIPSARGTHSIWFPGSRLYFFTAHLAETHNCTATNFATT
jgi:hypothetical protein